MKLESVNEGSTLSLSVEFLSERGTPVAPLKVFWKIEDLMSGSLIKDWTEIANPSSRVYLTIGPDICSILDQTNSSEVKRVTIKAEFGPNIVIVQEKDIIVQNLGGNP
jgi:hypothetical protein